MREASSETESNNEENFAYERLLESQETDVKSEISLWTTSSISIVLIGFIGGIEYSIVMTSLSEYIDRLGGSSLFYGCCISVFSLTRVCAMPVVGYWSDKVNMFQPLFFTISLSLLGNLLYASSEWLGSPWFVLIGRAMVGIGASSGTLTMSYVTRCSSKENRTKVMTTISAFNMSALVLGPVTNLITKDIHWHSPLDGLDFNEVTNPGWLMVLVLGVLLVVTTFTFEEPPSLSNDEEELSSACIVSLEDECQSISTPISRVIESSADWFSIYKRLWIEHSIWIFFIFSWTTNFVVSVLETSMPAVTRRYFDWDQLEISLLFCYVGACVISVYLGMHRLMSFISDRVFIACGLTLLSSAGAVAFLYMAGTNISLIPFFLFTTLIAFALPILGSPNMSLYSKSLESYGGSEYIGLFMSFIQQSNCIARLVAPIYTGYALGFRKLIFLHIPTTALVGICAITLLWKWKLFKPEAWE